MTKRTDGVPAADLSQERTFRAALRRHSLTTYFVLTYLLSWAFLIPSYRILLDAGWAQDGLDEVPPLALIGLVGAFGPTLAALIVVGGYDARAGMRRLVRRLSIWRVPPGWYLFALFGPALVFLAALAATSSSGPGIGPLVLENAGMMALAAIAITLPFGPVPEELGWRGYALPRLLQRHRPIAASLILGLFWTLWHVPAFFVPGIAIPSAFAVTPLTVLLYLANNTALCLVFTGLFLRSKGSVLLAILLHAGSNASPNIIYGLFPEAPHSVGSIELVYGVDVALIGLLGLGMLIRRPRHLGPGERSGGAG